MTGSYSPQRIACLQPSATVILASIGALDRVVACTKYCADVVPELSDNQLNPSQTNLSETKLSQPSPTVIADSWNASAAEILRSKPDLVIAAVPYQEKSVAEILKAGVRFLGLAPRSLADIYADIAVIANLVNASERGEEVISHMQSEIANIRHATANLPRKRVFCEEWGKPIITSQPWVQELVETAGGHFLGKPGSQITSEEVAAADPEVIIAAWCGAGDRVPLEKIVRDRGWLSTTAAKTSHVYCISDELLNTPAPTLMDGLHALATAIHPDAFPLSNSGQKRLRRIRETATASVVSA